MAKKFKLKVIGFLSSNIELFLMVIWLDVFIIENSIGSKFLEIVKSFYKVLL
jgi:hypothetical protein